MQQVNSAFEACSSIFFAPKAVFTTLNEKQNWSWLPFVMIMLAAMLPTYFYFTIVDFEWYRDFLVNTNYSDVSPAEQDTIRNSMQQGSVMAFGLVAIFLGVVVINAVIALYYNLVTKIDEQSLHGFTDWYGFTWWTAMPSILVSLLSLVLLLLAENGQIQPHSLSPSSLAYLFNVAPDSDWFGLAQGIRLDSFWSMYLAAIGITCWTSISMRTATLIAIAPSAVIWLIWAVIVII